MQTVTQIPATEPAFHADDAEQVAGYRTVSALAIISLVFGLASPLCFAWPLMMAIPIFGTAISIVALLRIAASDGALAGRWAATAGLALCLICGAAAVSRNAVSRFIRTRQAEEVGRNWIGLLLADDAEQAFHFTVTGNRREPPPEPGMPAPTETPYEQFALSPIVPTLAAAGRDADIRYVETLSYEPQARRQFLIQQKFVVTPKAAAEGTPRDPVEVHLTLQRSQLMGEPQSRWLVANFEVPQAAAEADHVH
ncbi:MAG: hypothetical protein WD738_06645 [Pirellulales bacterium]